MIFIVDSFKKIDLLIALAIEGFRSLYKKNGEKEKRKETCLILIYM